MRITMTILLLSLSAGFATPSLANYFFNPYTNGGRNVGSAPSPTPQDVKENHLPRLVHAAPPYADVMPADMATKTDKPVANDRVSAQVKGGRHPSSAQASR